MDLGLAEKLAVRAVATATGSGAEQVAASVRETGDLGQAAEQMLTVTAAGRPASLPVTVVVDTLHRIAEAEGPGSQGRKLDLLAGLLAQATPLEARYLLRLVTGRVAAGDRHAHHPGRARAGVRGRAGRPAGAGTRLQHLLRPGPGRRRAGRAAGWRRSSSSRSARATRCGPCSPSGCLTPRRSWPSWAGECAAEYKYDGVRVQAHRTADGTIELFTRRLERVSTQFPDVVELLAAGLGPSEAIVEGEVVAFDAAAGELRPFQEVMFRRRKHGISRGRARRAGGPVLLRAALRRRPGPHQLPYPQRRARLAEAITPSPQLRLTTATEVTTPAALDAAFEQAVTDGCEGLVCKSVSPAAGYQAGARGWLWIKLKRDYRTELSDTVDLAVVGAFAGRGRRRGVYGALLLAAYDPDADVFRTVTKCGTGFSDADLAALPARLAPLARADRPARVDARQQPDVWFEPGLVLEILSAELTLSPNYTAGWGQIKEDAGLAMRFPRFTGRWRDDKAAQDATTTSELIDLYRTAQRAPAGT